jgi:uncharacterized protein GlcG (DUF336 family)
MNRTYLIAGVLAAGAAIAFAVVPGPADASVPAAVAAAPSTTAGASAVASAPYLKLASAKRAADVTMAACLAKGYPTSVTIVDRDGVLIAAERADTATGATVDVSRQKAYAAVGFQISTADIQNFAKTQPGFIAIEGFSALPGGLPIRGGNTIVAGIGVSGAPTGELDEECAVAGINAIS